MQGSATQNDQREPEMSKEFLDFMRLYDLTLENPVLGEEEREAILQPMRTTILSLYKKLCPTSVNPIVISD